MDCYTIECVDRCAHPRLTTVKQTYILTLDDARTFQPLHGITAETYVQRNRGFVACRKSCDHNADYVSQTYMDITHAYKSLFRSTMHNTDPILVLEDDTELMPTAPLDWAAVDQFIAQNEFSVYSLGTFGMVVPSGGGHWRYLNAPIFGPIQSVIYSHPARQRIMSVSTCEIGHLDTNVLSQFHRKYTFHRPLTHQTLRDTANSRSWCVACNGGYVDRAHRAVSKFLIRLMGLDGDSERGFARVYQIHKLMLPCLLVCVALLTSAMMRVIDSFSPAAFA